MKTLFQAAGIRARLLGLVLLLILPILLATVLFSAGAYRQNLAAIEAARLQIANDFAARTRVWFRGSARSLLATLASVGSTDLDAAGCSHLVRAATAANRGYRAMLITLRDGRRCVASLDPDIRGEDLDTIAAVQAARPALKSFSGAAFAPSRYDAFDVNGRRFLTVHLTLSDSAQVGGSALLIADLEILDSTFDIGPLEGAIVGLVTREGRLLAQRGEGEPNGGWLPATLKPASGYTRIDTASRDGEEAQFAVLPVADSDLEIVARFSPSVTKDAWLQYLIMTLTPLAVAIFLFLVYSFALQRDVVRWILGIKLAARARIEDARSQHLAPVSDAMPRELRSVARAFNTMVTEANSREFALQSSLEQNRFLMRELHHRVKNSLQVIQSYLSLAQRESGRDKRGDLTETEARVQVLAIAYRLGLTDGGMSPVLLRPLAEEIISNLASVARSEHQWISLSADIDVTLEVDRSIPFGLAIVEGVIAALRSPGCTRVQVEIAPSGDGRWDFVIGSDAGRHLIRPNKRILQGLSLQLQARPHPEAEGEVLRWTFKA
jgi:two-component sensor histidine kinase